jgi:4-carboxymuconolactone decarboxylase
MPEEYLSMPDLSALTPEQQVVADSVASGPRGEVRGPVRLWLHSPELANRAQKLGEFLRWGTALEPRICEIVILVTSRHYDSHYMWFNHVETALKHGVSPKAIDCIKNGQAPHFDGEDEQAAYDFVSGMLTHNRVTVPVLIAAKAHFGERGVVEMGAIIAHYHSGAIVLSLADVTLPDGSKSCLP